MNATRRMLYDDPRHNEQDHPHIVEMAVPEGGLRDRLAAMHDWHRAPLSRGPERPRTN